MKRTIPNDWIALNCLISLSGWGTLEQHYRLTMLQRGTTLKWQKSKYVNTQERGSRWLWGQCNDKVGKESILKGQLHPGQVDILRCSEHWTAFRGCFWTRNLFVAPTAFRRSLFPSTLCRRNLQRWGGWSWLLQVLPTHQILEEKVRIHHSSWGEGRTWKPSVLGNLLGTESGLHLALSDVNILLWSKLTCLW